MPAAAVRGQSNQVLSAVLRAGRESTAGLSPLSTPDSILMCYRYFGDVQNGWLSTGGSADNLGFIGKIELSSSRPCREIYTVAS